METIYIVEDDDNIRKLVCYALKREGYEVESFALPSQFYGIYNKAKPVSMLQNIRNTDPDTPVIMLTAKDSEFDKVTGLDMGADDYIAKPFGMTELVSRIRAVLRRSGRKTDKAVYRFGALGIDIARHTVTVSDKDITLSYKEFALLEALIKADGKVISREELFEKVWGGYYGETRTLDVHIRNLRKKLGIAGKYIRTVKGIGYRLGENNE